MMNTILLIIGLILCTAGVIFIYDARDIAKKVFGFGDQNEATSGLKILGFIIIFVFLIILILFHLLLLLCITKLLFLYFLLALYLF